MGTEGVDAEAARALPGEHAGGVELVQEPVATEVAEDPSLEGGLHLADVIGRQLGGLVKLDVTVARLAEHAVEHDEMVVRVDVEGRAEAMKEADWTPDSLVRRARRAGQVPPE
jgi:hypothetical protein